MSKRIKYQIGVQLKGDVTKVKEEPIIDVVPSKDAEKFVEELKAGLDPYIDKDYELVILMTSK